MYFTRRLAVGCPLALKNSPLFSLTQGSSIVNVCVFEQTFMVGLGTGCLSLCWLQLEINVRSGHCANDERLGLTLAYRGRD